jgi:hypothetical protein
MMEAIRASEATMKPTVIRMRVVRFILLFFMLALTASGLSAVPLQWEVGLLSKWIGMASFMHALWPSLASWIERVNAGVQNGYGQYPFLAYGTDWLAFGHVAIALSFIGPLRDPVRNIWVVEFGMIACVLVIPWALFFIWMRGIPPFWTLVDMSFGVVGIVPLWWARRLIVQSAEEPGKV